MKEESKHANGRHKQASRVLLLMGIRYPYGNEPVHTFRVGNPYVVIVFSMSYEVSQYAEVLSKLLS